MLSQYRLFFSFLKNDFRQLATKPAAHIRFKTSAASLAGNLYSTILVVGAGQMGTGIGFCGALSILKNYTNALPTSFTPSRVIITDVSEKALKNSESAIRSWLKRRQFNSNETDRFLQEILFFQPLDRLLNTNSSELSSIGFCIEAVAEDFNIKSKLLMQLDQNVPKTAILASNTSSISITKLAAQTQRPQNVIGMHFMNPVPVMEGVEVIPGLATDQHTLQTTLQLAKWMQKRTTQSADRPGFIANRILMPYINEAIFTLQEKTATVQDIDTLLEIGTRVPMGPLRLADFIGLDTCLAILKVLHNEWGDPKFRPATTLIQYVDAGWLGQKVGKGFYTYDWDDVKQRWHLKNPTIESTISSS